MDPMGDLSRTYALQQEDPTPVPESPTSWLSMLQTPSVSHACCNIPRGLRANGILSSPNSFTSLEEIRPSKKRKTTKDSAIAINTCVGDLMQTEKGEKVAIPVSATRRNPRLQSRRAHEEEETR
jgi:hypothetical protein